MLYKNQVSFWGLALEVLSFTEYVQWESLTVPKPNINNQIIILACAAFG